jgi:hypothetical protein
MVDHVLTSTHVVVQSDVDYVQVLLPSFVVNQRPVEMVDVVKTLIPVVVLYVVVSVLVLHPTSVVNHVLDHQYQPMDHVQVEVHVKILTHVVHQFVVVYAQELPTLFAVVVALHHQ